MKIGSIKADTPKAQPHVIPEVEKHQKCSPEWKEPAHTVITPYQAPREGTM